MNVRIRPSTVAGTVQAPPSKSYTHRAILAGGLSDSATVRDPLMSADTKATMGAVEAYGGEVDRETDELSIQGVDGRPQVPADVIDCHNSGTTMRLVTGTAALVDGTTVLTGDESLRARPQGPLLEALVALGAQAQSTRENGQAPLVVTGPIAGGAVAVRGDVSSQYITSLLMAGACTADGIEIELTTPLKSAPYVEITREVLSAFGVSTQRTDAGFYVDGGQSYRAETYPVPGDFSSISYLLGTGVVASPDGLTIDGAVPSSQGDTAIVDVVQEMGGAVTWNQDAGTLTATKSPLTGTTVDVGDTPDLLPTIAALGAIAGGTTRLTNCEHVRYKETDRVDAMATELAKMGADVEESQDELVVHGGRTTLEGAVVDGYHDHRIIMSLCLAGLGASGETTVRGAEHVDVSFPDFFDVLSGIGATVTRE